MSGYADYYNSELYNFNRYPVINVHIIRATPENFAQYGRIIPDYNEEEVVIKPWPVSGTRQLMPNTGIGGGITEGVFSYWYDGDYLHAKNRAVSGDYITGRVFENTILTREANYHPDSGQVFWAPNGVQFILLLARPGDNVTPNDFVGFYFDGSQAVQIWPDIWHQPVFPVGIPKADFMTKQGKVHGCVGVDFINEFGVWLGLDLSGANIS
jgi:ureidoglycolate lyase